MVLDSPSKRLRWAREQHGRYSTPTEAARGFGWKTSTYLGHENGDRNPSRAAAKRYAKAYRVRWEWLLDNEGPPTAKPGTVATGLPGASHLRILRQAFGIKLADLGISEADWNEIEAGGELSPALVLTLHDLTKLPLSYIRHGLTDELSPEAAKQLLSASLKQASASADIPRPAPKRVRSRSG